MIKKNIKYLPGSSLSKHTLDVHYRSSDQSLPVIIFIHGGSWMSGDKKMYTRLGENFLELDVITVIINYRLFPSTDIYGMKSDCSAACQWTLENITEFGGDPDNVFLMGHSAGGHLSAATAFDNSFHKKIRGVILVDAFGLSAWHFLNDHAMWIPEFFSQLFGADKEKWPLVSPDILVHKNCPPCLVLTGSKTYPFLTYDNEQFIERLKDKGLSFERIITEGKTHNQMIWQFESAKAKSYSQVLEFIKGNATGLI